MKIPSFKEFCENLDINEMAHISGVKSNDSHSMKHDWDSFYKNDTNTKLIVNKIPGGYKLYNNGSNYFLTDVNDEYKGSLVLTNVTAKHPILKQLQYNNVQQISSSNQDGTVKGFYNIIFSSLLTHTDIDGIMSDNDLSTNALNSYDRLYNNSHLNLFTYVPQSQKVIEFNKNIMNDELSAVVLVSSDKKLLKEIWDRYINKITTNISYINEYYNKHTNKLDENNSLYLFCFTKSNGQIPIDEWC